MYRWLLAHTQHQQQHVAVMPATFNPHQISLSLRQCNNSCNAKGHSPAPRGEKLIHFKSTKDHDNDDDD